jgi:uncharacterized membrane-anchored protein
MKLNKQVEELIERVVKSYILEAEEEADPFAAAAEGGPEAAEKAGEEDTEKKAEPEKPAGVPVKFNVSAVKKYNNANFVSDSGVVKSIDKKGVVVTTQPDGVDVLVNFDDISENVKKFFKKK